MATGSNPSADETRTPGIAESGREIAYAARDWLKGITELATLELRYSMRSAVAALIGAALLAATLFSSWALILATLTVILIEAGLSWIPTLLLINAVNLSLSLGLWILMKRLIDRIGLDATRHAIGLGGATNHEKYPATDPTG